MTNNKHISVKKERFVELCIFLLLIVPSMLLSLFVIRQGSLSFSFIAISTIVRNAGLVALIFFFLWRNHESKSRIGCKLDASGNDAIVGALYFIPVYYGAALIQIFLSKWGLSSPQIPHQLILQRGQVVELGLALLLVIVVAISEEIIFRGYLIDRILTVSNSKPVAVLVASLIFALGHTYEGAAGVVTIFLLGIVFSLLYLRRGSLIAPMTLHFMINFTSIILSAIVKK